jgi:hypothetical protein
MREPQQVENQQENFACHATRIHVHATNMKCAPVFVFISVMLASGNVVGVLRPQFPTKAAPPFRGDIIAIGDEMIQHTSKTGPAPAPK